MSLLFRLLGVSLLLMLSTTTYAVIESHEFEDELLRTRYQQLSAELRCPKCQNQNIADSNAPIAHDLREQLYAQLNAGRSDAEIVDYMVQRYGEFVMYRPRWSKVTMVLWLAPVILFGLALWVLLATLRRGKTQAMAAPALTEAEQRRLDDILGEDRE